MTCALVIYVEARTLGDTRHRHANERTEKIGTDPMVVDGMDRRRRGKREEGEEQ